MSGPEILAAAALLVGLSSLVWALSSGSESIALVGLLVTATLWVWAIWWVAS